MDNKNNTLFSLRKTTDKPIREMGMYELALNNCYIKDRQAYYRDFEGEHDAHVLIREIAEKLGITLYAGDNDILDFTLFDWLEEGIENTQGILALLYSLLLSKAEPHAKLKRYEDAEERGLLKYLPSADVAPVVHEKRGESNADRCVCCGDVIPEGRQVCPKCEGGEPTSKSD